MPGLMQFVQLMAALLQLNKLFLAPAPTDALLCRLQHMCQVSSMDADVWRHTTWLPSACAWYCGCLSAAPVNDKVVVTQAVLDVCSLHVRLMLKAPCAEKCRMDSHSS